MLFSDLTELKQALQTVCAIPITPFNQNGSADFLLYKILVTRMIDNGITVVTPNGNTGEFYSLNPAEMVAALDSTVAGVEASHGDALIMASVGFDAETATQMAVFASQQGAQAIMIHQPVHPYRSDEGWIAYHKQIADAVPNLAIVPYVRDATIGSAALGGLAAVCPNFVGVKYAVPNPKQFATIVREVGPDRLTWICGIAESWAPFFWPGGATGFTSGLVNVTTGPSLAMQNALEASDYPSAMTIWAQIKPFEDLRARHNNANNVSGVKEAMAQIGLCNATVRPPISELTVDERDEVKEILQKLGVASAQVVA